MRAKTEREARGRGTQPGPPITSKDFENGPNANASAYTNARKGTCKQPQRNLKEWKFYIFLRFPFALAFVFLTYEPRKRTRKCKHKMKNTRSACHLFWDWNKWATKVAQTVGWNKCKFQLFHQCIPRQIRFKKFNIVWGERGEGGICLGSQPFCRSLKMASTAGEKIAEIVRSEKRTTRVMYLIF